jgi:hypothetical protein
MSDSLKQDQRSGDESTNIQAQTVELHYHGITASEARQIALDVFKANALELVGIGKELFESRGREFVDRYLAELRKRRPEGLESLRDPDMQYALFTAQRDYARTGRADLEAVLIDLLVERAAAITDLKRIVLNEAIAVAAKLTEAQLDALSAILILVHGVPFRYSFESRMDFRDFLSRYVTCFIHEDLAARATYLHLKYVGCASMDSGGTSLFVRFAEVFPGCLTMGFNNASPGFGTDERALHELATTKIPDLIMPCWHNPDNWQTKPMDDRTFWWSCKSRGLDDDTILQFRLQGARLAPQGGDFLRALDLRLDIVVGPFSPLRDVQLTSVGIALANANIRRKTGLEFDLGIWIK